MLATWQKTVWLYSNDILYISFVNCPLFAHSVFNYCLLMYSYTNLRFALWINNYNKKSLICRLTNNHKGAPKVKGNHIIHTITQHNHFCVCKTKCKYSGRAHKKHTFSFFNLFVFARCCILFLHIFAILNRVFDQSCTYHLVLILIFPCSLFYYP